MADNSVFITGAAEGAFTAAMSGLPPWATEDTAMSIEGILKKTYDLQTDTLRKLVKGINKGGSGKDKNVKLTSDELEKLAKNIPELNKHAKKQKKDWLEEDDRVKKGIINWKNVQANMKLFTVALDAAAVAIQRTFKENFDTYTKLNEAGINLVSGFDSASSGFQALAQLTTITSIRFTELSAIMQKNAAAVNAFGVSKFAKSISGATKDLAQFGFSSKESAELLSSYLEIQQGYTDVNSKSQQEVTQDLVNFGARLNKLSLATGMARGALMANIEAISKTNEATVLQGQVGVEAAEATLEFVGSMKNQNFGRALLKMMTDTIKPLNTTFQSFQKIGLGGFGSKMMAFTQSLKGMDPEAARQAVKTFEEQNRAEIEHAKQQANFYSQIPELAGEANAALTTFNELQQTARQTKRLSAEDLEKLKKTNEARANLNSEWERLMSQLQKVFYPTPGMINMLVTGLKILNGAIEGVVKVFDVLGTILGAIIHPLDALTGKVEKIDLLPWAGLGIIMLAAFKTVSAFVGKLASLKLINTGALSEAMAKGASAMKDVLIKSSLKVYEFSKTAAEFIGKSLMKVGNMIWDAGKNSINYIKQALMRMGESIWNAGKASLEFISKGAGKIWTAISEFGSTLSKIPGRIMTYLGKIPGSIMSYIKGLLPKFGGGLTNMFGTVGKVISGIFPKIIGFVTKMFGIIGWLYTAWEAGQAIGTQIYKMIANFQWFADLTDKVAEAFDKTVDYVSDIFTSIADSIGKAFKWIKEKFSFFSGSSDKKAEDTSRRSASGKVGDQSAANNSPASNQPSPVGAAPNTSAANSPSMQPVAPVKPPTQSTISSPSQVSAAPSKQTTENGNTTPDKSATTKDKPTGDSAINTSLDYQNTLLEQLLLTMNSSVSTSKDILKYTRAST